MSKYEVFIAEHFKSFIGLFWCHCVCTVCEEVGGKYALLMIYKHQCKGGIKVLYLTTYSSVCKNISSYNNIIRIGF
jgi:hypothetical protein